MTIQRKVWTFEEVEIAIYLEDENGNVETDEEGAITQEPLFTYCYAESLNIEGTIEFERRPIPGRAKRKLVSFGAYEYSASVKALHFIKSRELNTSEVFNRETRLTLQIKRNKPEYEGQEDDADGNPYNEVDTLRHAVADSFGINGSDNEVLTADATFLAEEFT